MSWLGPYITRQEDTIDMTVVKLVRSRAATSTDFCNWLTGPPNSNPI